MKENQPKMLNQILYDEHLTLINLGKGIDIVTREIKDTQVIFKDLNNSQG